MPEKNTCLKRNEADRWGPALGIVLTVGILLTMALHTRAEAGHDKSTKAPFRPNEEIQALLDGLLSSDEQKMFSGTEDELQTQLAGLEEMIAGSHVNLVPELAYYSSRATNMRQAMLSAVIVKLLKISKGDLASGLIPLLDAQDEALRKESGNLLGEVDAPASGREPDFSYYESVIREDKEDIPEGLVTYMFKRDPDTALRTMATVYFEKREAEALMRVARQDNSARALNDLSRRKEWWVQYYVIEKMRQDPELRSGLLMKRLEESSHPLVQRALKEEQP